MSHWRDDDNYLKFLYSSFYPILSIAFILHLQRKKKLKSSSFHNLYIYIGQAFSIERKKKRWKGVRFYPTLFPINENVVTGAL